MAAVGHKKVRLQTGLSYRTPSGVSWRLGQTRMVSVNDPELAYYEGNSSFLVWSTEPTQHPEPVAPKSAAPKPAPPSPEPSEEGAKVELLPDKELSRLKVADLVEYAHSVGLTHIRPDSHTKKQIRAEIDKLR